MKKFLIYVTGAVLERGYLSIWSVGAESEEDARSKVNLNTTQNQKIVRVVEIRDELKFISIQ